MRARTLVAVAALFARPAFAQEGNERAARLAAANGDAKAALAYVQRQAATIRDPALRRAVQEILADPVPTFLATYPDVPSREAARQALVSTGLLPPETTVDALFPPVADKGPARPTFLAAPGGTPDLHHAYPGGLPVHTAFNLRAALALEENYRHSYKIALRRDFVLAAPILHDAFKAWVLQWKADGSLTHQAKVAGTASHHPMIAAEALHRGLPPEFVIALASAHDPPGGASEPIVVGYLRAAAIVAKVDPVEIGLLVRKGNGFALPSMPGFEATINHLSDHDYVLTDPASRLVADALVRIGRATPGGESFDDARLRWMRLRIQSRIPGMRLYHWLREGGDEGLRKELARAKVPLVDPSDASP